MTPAPDPAAHSAVERLDRRTWLTRAAFGALCAAAAPAAWGQTSPESTDRAIEPNVNRGLEAGKRQPNDARESNANLDRKHTEQPQPDEKVPGGGAQIPGHILQTGEIAALNAPSASLIRALLDTDDSRNMLPADGTKPLNVPYAFTDRRHILNGVSYRNLGVEHTPEAYSRHADFITAAIDEADVVLLERGDRYFPFIERQALSLGKAVAYVDTGNAASLQGLAANAAASIAGFSLGCDRFLTEPPHRMSGGVRGLVRAAGWFGALTGFPSLPTLLQLKMKPECYPNLDCSLVTDGRTVQMLAWSRQALAEYPRLKFLSITGDYHALGIEHYLKHSTEHGLKRGLYTVMYRWLGGGLAWVRRPQRPGDRPTR